MGRNGFRYNDRTVHDGLGDGGERFRMIATALVERGWNAAEITEDIAARPWHFAIPPDWSDDRLQREIEACGAARAPLETKPAAKAEQILDDGLPGWLRGRIESLEIPVDRDLYLRDVVAALACRGWDRARITIEIAGRPWVPERYAGHHLEYGVQERCSSWSRSAKSMRPRPSTSSIFARCNAP